jgi:hypothetical protein
VVVLGAYLYFHNPSGGSNNPSCTIPWIRNWGRACYTFDHCSIVCGDLLAGWLLELWMSDTSKILQQL